MPLSRVTAPEETVSRRVFELISTFDDEEKGQFEQFCEDFLSPEEEEHETTMSMRPEEEFEEDPEDEPEDLTAIIAEMEADLELLNNLIFYCQGLAEVFRRPVINQASKAECSITVRTMLNQLATFRTKIDHAITDMYEEV